MNELHKGSNSIDFIVESKEGERGPLCSNKANVRSPSLEFTLNDEYTSEDFAIEYLSKILVEIYIRSRKKND
jgi:hypothetical protein